MSYAIEHVTDRNGICQRCGKALPYPSERQYELTGGPNGVYYDRTPPINTSVWRCGAATDSKPSGYAHDAFSTAEDPYPGGPITR